MSYLDKIDQVIVCPAIRCDGEVFPSHKHFDASICDYLVGMCKTVDKETERYMEAGFITQYLDFVNPIEALSIARTAGQISYSNTEMLRFSDIYNPKGTFIIAAANRIKETKLIVVSARHADATMRAQYSKFGISRLDTRRSHMEQGFIDNHGKWYTREEALIQFERVGQRLADPIVGRMLFSENIY